MELIYYAFKGFTVEKEEWFVPLSVALEGVGPVEASWQPPGNGNTIWQTVNHLNYWNARILSSLNNEPNEPQTSNDDTFGEPGNTKDFAGWQDTLECTRQIEKGLEKALAKLTDVDLG